MNGTAPAGGADGRAEGREEGRAGGREEGRAAARTDGFGPWRILEVLGEGSSGRVLLARRADLPDGRQVALKTLHSPSPGALARFELERQALARLEHPAIARLYDAGTSDAGVPYVVLEHVDGLPIDLHCERRALGIEARIHLFLEVCAGVRHAHRHLIVHRDLKPANILVDRDGRPRLLDFGIARLLDAPPGEAAGSETALAEASARTPAYASPEQIQGGPITTATDVFSLGTVLYELLAGRSPWPAAVSRHQLERAICEDDPPPASRAARLAGAPARRARRLAGQLDAILAKALAKAPADRYPSVDALARDLESHLGHRPLLARPPGAAAKAGLFLRRHLAASLAAAALAAALGVFLLVLGRQAAELRAERDNARRTLAFLIGIFQAEPAPAGAAGRPAPTARQLLGRGAERVEKELAGQPAAQAMLLGVIGQVYYNLGFYPEAAGLHRRAAGMLAGSGELERAAADFQLGRALVARGGPGDLAAGEKLLREALEARGRLLPAGSAERVDGLTELADVLEISNPFALRESIELRREAAALAAGDDPARRLVTLGSLGRALALDRQLAAARQINDAAWALAAATPDAPSAALASGIFEAGVAMFFAGDPRSLPLYQRSLAIRRQVLPAGHPRLLENQQGVALALLEEQRWAEAREQLEQIVAGKYRGLGKDHYLVFPVELELARCIGELGDWPAATALAGEVLARAEASGKSAGDLAFIHGRLYNFEHLRGRLEIAGVHLRRAQEYAREAGMPRAELIQLELNRASLDADLGRLQAARQRFEALIAELRDPAFESWRLAYAQGAYARLLARLGRGEEAVALAESSYDQLSAHFGPRSRNLRSTLAALEEAYRAKGDRAASEKVEIWLREPARRPARL